MLVFNSQPGVVGAIVTGQTLPFNIVVGGNGTVPAFPAFFQIRAILTGFDYAGQSGLGVSHSLRDRIYVYIFGERMGEASITGIAFAGVCQQSGSWTGFDGVHAYYERCRASSQGALVRLVFGPNTTLYGFMYGLKFSLADPDTGIGSFSFSFKALPRVVTAADGLPPLPWENVTSIPQATP